MDWIFVVCVVRFGTIISTKAILDKNTNKCKGYGFVDFESPQAAESAVKALQLQGIQAQMAKVIVKVINTHFFALPFIASLKIVDDLSTDSGPYIPVAFLSFLTHLFVFFCSNKSKIRPICTWPTYRHTSPSRTCTTCSTSTARSSRPASYETAAAKAEASASPGKHFVQWMNLWRSSVFSSLERRTWPGDRCAGEDKFVGGAASIRFDGTRDARWACWIFQISCFVIEGNTARVPPGGLVAFFFYSKWADRNVWFSTGWNREKSAKRSSASSTANCCRVHRSRFWSNSPTEATRTSGSTRRRSTKRPEGADGAPMPASRSCRTTTAAECTTTDFRLCCLTCSWPDASSRRCRPSRSHPTELHGSDSTSSSRPLCTNRWLSSSTLLVIFFVNGKWMRLSPPGGTRTGFM